MSRWFGLVLAASLLLAPLACGTTVKVKGDDDGAGGGGACDSGLANCDNRCVDLDNDATNCGSCGNVCPPHTDVCFEGQCTTSGECPPGTQSCFGFCVDVSYDHNNCGACGVMCGADQICEAAFCLGGECPPFTIDCGGICVDPAYDPQHCGGCNIQCPPGAQCFEGLCDTGCPGVVCGNECVDLFNNPNHCGGCFQPCGPGEQCNSGSCVGSCPNPTCGACNVITLPSQVPQSASGFPSGDELSPTCGAPGSPEQMYAFTAPSTGTYTFDTNGSSYDTVLYLKDPMSCLDVACNDDYQGLQSLITVPLQAGQQVLVIVDGFGGNNGNYVLNISL